MEIRTDLTGRRFGRLTVVAVDHQRQYLKYWRVKYLVDNQEDGVMEYYNETGELVYTRPLTKTERQGNLQFESKR